MEIVVAVKQAPDTSVPPQIDPDRPAAVRAEGLIPVFNPGDRFALEAAVRLKEQRGDRVTAITVGAPSAERVLRASLAAGADRALRLWDDAFVGSDARATAAILLAAISSLQPSLVLCGRRSIDGETALVPAFLAEALGQPFVSGVTAIEVAASGTTAIVQRAVDRGDREIIRCQLPAVFAVEAGINDPRYASLPDLLAALRAPIEVRDLAALGLPRRRVGQLGSLAKVVALLPPRPRPKKAFTPDSSLSAEERLQLVLSGGIAEKKGNLLEGKPDEVAAQMLQFLERENLLP